VAPRAWQTADDSFQLTLKRRVFRAWRAGLRLPAADAAPAEGGGTVEEQAASQAAQG
jgi:hypothetical protein